MSFHRFQIHFLQNVSSAGSGLQSEIVRLDGGGSCEQNRSLHHVSQLANIAGPRISTQRLKCLWTHIKALFPVTRRELSKKVPRQFRDIINPLAQGRQMHLDGVEPEIKVFPESTGIDFCQRVSIRGAQNPNVYLFCFRRSYPLEFASFENSQDFGLLRAGQIRDFIEKESATVRQFETAGSVRPSIGESAFDVSKHLTLK